MLYLVLGTLGSLKYNNLTVIFEQNINVRLSERVFDANKYSGLHLQLTLHSQILENIRKKHRNKLGATLQEKH